jgi:hypothetical protein
MHERKAMTHAHDGLLLAYADGEIDGPAAAELREHLAVCGRCAGELNELQQLSSRAHDALGLLHADAPMLRAQAALATEHGGSMRGWRRARLGASGLARAAMLLLALAGAAAAAIPGSPVRRVLETTFARVAGLFTSEAEAPPAPATDVAPVVTLETTSVAIAPADGRVRIVLHAPAGAVDVQVRLVDGSRARLEALTPAPDVRLRSAAGRIEVLGLSAGVVRIEIPRRVASATVEVGGQVYAYKDGQVLRLSGPAGAASGAALEFRIAQ